MQISCFELVGRQGGILQLVYLAIVYGDSREPAPCGGSCNIHVRPCSDAQHRRQEDIRKRISKRSFAERASDFGLHLSSEVSYQNLYHLQCIRTKLTGCKVVSLLGLKIVQSSLVA